MKITKVDVMHLDISLQGYRRWQPIILRIYTDEGIYGDGEAALAYGIGASAAFGMLKDMSKLIIGMDPMDIEVVWNKLYKNTFWGQNGGPVVFSGISAIDIALWDIKGKALNLPVYKLLGGKFRDKLRTYASQLQIGWGEELVQAYETKDYYAAAKRAVADGYDCVKVDFFTNDKQGGRMSKEQTTRLLAPYYVDLVEERVAAVREAVGPSVDIIMENHSHTDTLSAVQLAQRVEKYNIFYFEEPNTPDPKTAKYLKEKINIPIAQGERIYTRWQYAKYFEDMSLQVIQPDLGTCGGITEGKKICDLAYTYDVSVQAHVCASPLSTAAALHLESAIPNFIIHEHHAFMLTPENRKLCIYDYQPENGKFRVPELPGLGNEFSEYALSNCDKVTVE